jgi:hypothetical protein
MKNQAYFQRNLMPGMLGWFSMRPDMSLEDMEWMLARSAAYDAGYAFVTSFDILEKHGQADKILGLINVWEQARMSGAFPDSLKKEMEDLDNEYHLEVAGEDSWTLYRIATGIFHHKQIEKPSSSTFTFNNPYRDQPPTITIRTLKNTGCRNIKLEIDNYKSLIFPVDISNGQIIRYEGGNSAGLYDKYWNYIKTISVSTNKMILTHGEHRLSINTEFTGGKEPEISVEFKVASEAIGLKAQD